MDKHTREPWKLFRNDQSVGDSRAYAVCDVWPRNGDGLASEEGKANARRIVACVNACEGFSTEYLEHCHFDSGDLPEAKYAKLLAERDDLLEQIRHLTARLESAKRSWPDKCPITRRNFFMEIDGVPTYGGPYDSYTIPEMLGTPDQPWHDRELFVRRFDHDRGHWVDDEVIDLRVIYDGVLDELLDDQVAATLLDNKK